MSVFVRCAALSLVGVAVWVAPSAAQESCTQPGQVLVAPTPDAEGRQFGGSVAISNDAEWIAVGMGVSSVFADAAGRSGASIYRRIDGVYSLDRPLLQPDEANQGRRYGIVRLSGAGRTLALTSLGGGGDTVTYDRTPGGAPGQGQWVRVPGTFGPHALPNSTGFGANYVPRPVDLNADGTLAVVNVLNTIILYARPTGYAPGTPWTQAQTLRVPVPDFEGDSNPNCRVALSSDGTLIVVSTVVNYGTEDRNLVEFYRRTAAGGPGGAGVWTLERSVLTASVVGAYNRGDVAISPDNELVAVRSTGAGTVMFRKVAGQWTQLNTVPLALSRGQLALGPAGAWGLAAEADSLKILRPAPNYQWTVSATIPGLYPYPAGTYLVPPNVYHRVEMTPDGRWAVVGTDVISPTLNGVQYAQNGFARVVDLRPPAVAVSQPQPQIVAAGGSAVFSFVVQAEAGTVPQFQWRRNGAAINNGPSGTGSVYAGTQTGTLTVSNVQPADQFAVFDCVVDACGGLVSARAPLSVQLGGGAAGCLADLGEVGGLPGSDGVLDNNDFIVFIDYFFNHTGCP